MASNIDSKSNSGSPDRARKALNSDTIKEMHAAFRAGGRKAIDKVMKNQPEVFLKLLVLLVPHELQVEHKGGVKAMPMSSLRRESRRSSGCLRPAARGPK